MPEHTQITTPQTPEDAKAPDFWDERSEILNWAWISYRYHRKRQRFFDLCDKLTQGAAVLVGLAVVSGKTVNDYAPYTGFAIAVLGVLALVFGYADRKQCHRELADLARQLAGEVQPVRNDDLNNELIGQWEKRRTEIELREPPNLPTLVQKCEWEQACAEGFPNHYKKPCILRQIHMHFF